MIVKKHRKSKFSAENTLVFIFIGLLILGAISFLVVSNLRIIEKRRGLVAETEEMKKRIQILEEENRNLQARIDQIKSDEYKKGKIYEQGYVEKGANQVVVLPPKENKEIESLKENGFWQRFLKRLKDFGF